MPHETQHFHGVLTGASNELPARQAVRTILLRLLDAMEANRPGAVAGEDAEFLHDFRVAVRRTRAALGQFRVVFAAEDLEHFRGEFRWLGELTGPLRDLDVYLQHFASYRSALPEEYRGDLEPFATLLRRRRQVAQQHFADALASRRYRTLTREWHLFLEESAMAAPLPAGTSMDELCAWRLRKLFARLLKTGGRIGAESPPEKLHALRILCKKLRYLLEFSGDFYPAKRVGRLIRELKTLQNNLGAFQDLSVQIRALPAFAEELAAAGKVPVRTLLAMGMLVEGLERRRQEARAAFDGTFARFARKKNRALFKSLFAANAADRRKGR